MERKWFPTLEDATMREAGKNALACGSVSVAVGAFPPAVPPIYLRPCLLRGLFSNQLLWHRPELSTYSYLRVPRCILSSPRGQHSLLQQHFCGRVEFPICNNALTLYSKSLQELTALVVVRGVCHSCGGCDRPAV